MARIYGSTNNSNWGLFVDLNETSYSVGNNSSNVRASVYLYRPNSASYYGGSATIGVSVNGEYKSTGFYPSYPTNIGAGEGNAHLAATFDYTVPHNDDGSKTVSMSMSWSANFSPSSGSASGSISLTNIPRQANITSAPDFTDEENPTITYENKAGNSVSSLQACISLTGSAADIEYRDIPKTGSSYTFELTDSERNVLRNATLSGSTQRQVIFHVKTGIGGNTYYSTLTRTLTIINANPTLTASIKDVNQNIINITGNNSVIVKDKSTARITASATAKKNASITSITVNKKKLSGSYIDLTGSNKYEIIATDNRNLTNTKNLVGGTDYTFVNYIPLTFSGSVSRHTPTGSQLDISFSGNYFNENIGQSTNNLTLRWQYKEKNASNWIDGGTFVKDVDFVINNNTFHSGTGNRESAISLGNIFSYQKSYEIKLLYNDLLESKEVILTGLKGIPVIDWGKDFFNVNGEIRINNVPIPQTTVSNVRSDSTTGTYSCNYINSISGGSGTTNYNSLTNLPKINGITLTGNKTSSQLGIKSPTKVSELENDLGFIDINYHDTTKQDKLVSGTNIKTINNESILGSGNINIQGGSGTSDYSQLENKPQINGIELNGNKSLNDLGINNFSGNYDDLSNKPTIPTVPTTLSSFTDDLGSSPTHTHSQYLTSHQDISGKVDKVTGKELSTNDFTNTYKDNVDSNTSARHTHSNKSVLDGINLTDITNWNNKSDFSGSYNDLIDKPLPFEIIQYYSTDEEKITKLNSCMDYNDGKLLKKPILVIPATNNIPGISNIQSVLYADLVYVTFASPQKWVFRYLIATDINTFFGREISYTIENNNLTTSEEFINVAKKILYSDTDIRKDLLEIIMSIAASDKPNFEKLIDATFFESNIVNNIINANQYNFYNLTNEINNTIMAFAFKFICGNVVKEIKMSYDTSDSSHLNNYEYWILSIDGIVQNF